MAEGGDGQGALSRKTNVTNHTAATSQSNPNLYENVEDDEELDDVLEWSWSYVSLCLLLPLCNGCINGFSWPALLLYFRDMSWPIWHGGLAVAAGFLGRTMIQHLQLQFGIWVALPMTLFHFTACILAIVFIQDDWAILLEMVCLHALDPTMSIEAVVYDFFKNQPGASRQATSTSLSIMTLAVALSTGVGGVIYDYWGWQGLAIVHTVFEGLVVVVLWLQKACWRSVAVVLLRREMRSKSSKVSNKEIQGSLPATERVDSEGTPATPAPRAFEDREAASPEIPGRVNHEGVALEDVAEAGHPVIPTARETVKSRRTKSDILQEMLDELDDDDDEEPATAEAAEAAESASRRTRFQDAEPEDEVKPKSPAASPGMEVNRQHSHGVSGRRTDHKLLDAYLQDLEADDLGDHPDESKKRDNASQRSKASQHSAWSRKSHRSTNRSVRSKQLLPATQKPKQPARQSDDVERNDQRAPPKRNSQMSAKSANSAKSKGTVASMASAISSMTSLAEAGMHFEHHFSVNASLRPKIATIGGQKKKSKKISRISEVRDSRASVQSTATANTVQTTTDAISWWVPPGYRLPSLLISVAYFCSHFSYMMLSSMYAVYYREQHSWSMAMYAGFCQCAGENLAGIAMRLVSTPFFATGTESVEDKTPCWQRLSNFLFSKPYDVAWCLFFWACLNAGFMSPWTPGTVIAQVLMATVYVILSKNAMEMCLLYAGGDPDLFLTLQNLARNVEQTGAALACAAGPLLYDFVDPNAPFIVTASVCGSFLIIYTVTFRACISLPDEYEDDEEYVEEYVQEYVDSEEEDE